MKVTYTKVLSRRILLVFIAFVIISAIIALFVRDSITRKLENISNLAHRAELDQSKPQNALLLVQQAEDDFQESLLNSDSIKVNAYKTKLSRAFGMIDTLLKEAPDTLGLTYLQHGKINSWYQKKLKLSDKLYTLKHDFDSLLNVYSGFNIQNTAAQNVNLHNYKTNFSNKSDTSQKDIAGKRRGLLGRLKDAITNKDGSTPSSKVIVINHNHTKKIVDSTTRKIIARDKNLYSKQLQQLQQKNISLLNTQKNLITMNVHITNELEDIINEEKEINYNLQNEFKAMSFRSYQDTTLLLDKFYTVALLLVLVFATLLIIFIINLDRSEMQLLEENKRAVGMAQQKMDLLLHMSHEIRNPLTAIQGFLYIFSKTPLTQRQEDMMSSIRLSSDMLLRTLNDTLDAAKMESNEFKINNDPFSPDFTLREVIESMEFSAAKKDLNIGYSFEGNQDAILLGDGFRLKQIMINLLSNAIKYTNTGGITVKASLSQFNEENRLRVAIIDTGEGISQEQQANLFSKYYQTNSSKGKIGTGLGLYICKELIQYQKGQIKVESTVGKGSTFSFDIPYTGITSRVTKNSQAANAPVSLLNGQRILAVDDNELNLLFLKTMVAKWNVKFYSAANGKEALGILNVEPIDIVLTDIEMPEMNGYELITAIRKLKKPLNKIPVVVMTGSGEPTGINKSAKKEISGVLGKPFTEAELVKQILSALGV